MQQIKRGTLQPKSILRVLFDVFRTFSQLYNDTSFIKIDQSFQILQIEKGLIIENSYCFLYYFLSVFIHILENHSLKAPPFNVLHYIYTQKIKCTEIHSVLFTDM